LPASLSKVDFSANPLGDSQSFILALGNLEKLRELRFVMADISNNSFPPDLFTSSLQKPFPSLRLLDLSETKVTAEAIECVHRQIEARGQLRLHNGGVPCGYYAGSNWEEGREGAMGTGG
jgi:hypothetical protein